jgi:sugar lactone lactonase YvrE
MKGDSVRRFVLLVSVLFLVLAAAPVGAARQFPDEIELPPGYFPEGIAVGKGSTFYVGSLSDGSIYKGDLRTGEGAVLTDPAGPFATVGIEVDNKERIWVAGGPSGTGRVYDGRTGALLETYIFTAPFESFVNDVVVTNEAAYFTDSGTAIDPDPGAFRFAGEPRLFVVPLGSGKSLPAPSAVETLATNIPDLGFPNLNGIETTPGGSSLIVGHTLAQALYTVDPTTGDGTEVDIGGVPLVGNDGLIRRGTTVYVVENALSQVSAVKITPDGSSGVVTNVYSVDGAETPTTAALFGNALYAVDARFGSMTGPYKVFRVELR